jgi:hypothetical protein
MISRIGKTVGILAVLLLSALPAHAQALSKFAGIGNVGRYAYGYNNNPSLRIAVGNTATGAASITVQTPYVTTQDNRTIFPLSTSAPITINPGMGNAETVTPSTVSSCGSGANPGTCTVSATFTYTHGSNEPIYSGSYGAYECAADLHSLGGVCLIDGSFQGTAGNISGARGLFSNVSFVDLRQGTLNVAGQVLTGRCSGTATASSTIGLFQLGELTAATCTSTTVTLGPVMNHAGTVSNLSVTAGTGGVGTGSGVFTVNVVHNGTTTNTTVTCTLNTGTTCSDTTHTATFAIGDIVTIQFTTASGETIANVFATVNAN